MGTSSKRHRRAGGVAAAMWPCLALLAAMMHLQGPCVSAQGQLGAGFLSLACGYSEGSPAFSDFNGITWQPDTNYVSGGQPYGPVNGMAAPELEALRFFPDNLKNCYDLPLGTVGAVYLIRAGFLYGNYDQTRSPPDFGISLGATMWVNSVKLDTGSSATHYEAIFTGDSKSIAVCLLRGQYGDPFINSLELRPLPTNSYSITNTSPVYLYPVKRINFGGPTLRYPKDPFDRIWTNWTQDYPDLVRQFSVLQTNTDIIYSGSAADLPPTSVLQTAIRPSVGNLSIAFSLPNALSAVSSQSHSPLYLSVFSAELNSTAIGGSLLVLQCDSFATTPTLLSPPFYAFRIGFTNQVFPNSTISCNLVKQGNSSADPIINALELHSIQPIATGTYGPDVTAMNTIRTAFKRQDWVGDPCLPISWEGVRCSSDNTPRVVGIVLPGFDGSKLGVTIPPAIGSLTSLTQLELENNDLFGPIPNELSALRNLSIFNIANNQLTGLFPLWLNTTYLPKLTQVFVQNNYFTGTFSNTLTNLGTNFSYAGGNQLCSVTDAACIGQPSPSYPTFPSPSPGKKSGGSSDKDRLAKIIGGVGGGLILLLLLLAILAWYVSEKKWSRREKERGRVAGFRERLNLANLGKYTGNLGKKDWKKAPLLKLSSNSGQLKTGVPDGIAPIRRFRYDELRQATNKFKTKLIEDELGVLYLGNLPKENRKVGVKVLSEFSQMTDEQFRSKVDLCSKLRHPNIVPLIGYSPDGSRQILVYEHMEGGELHRLLHDTANTRVLSWRERLNVALGAAKGIDYLHKCSPPVIHGDISSTNILLNDLFEAKIANSGLRNLEPDESFLNGSGSASSTQRLGYADPESLVIDQLTEKSDVYSFGVVLLEILCGRQPVSKFPPYDNHMQIVDWVKQSLNGGKVEEIVDSKMRIDYNEQALSKYTALSQKCVESEASRRPNIDFVVRELEETIQLQ